MAKLAALANPEPDNPLAMVLARLGIPQELMPSQSSPPEEKYEMPWLDRPAQSMPMNVIKPRPSPDLGVNWSDYAFDPDFGWPPDGPDTLHQDTRKQSPVPDDAAAKLIAFARVFSGVPQPSEREPMRPSEGFPREYGQRPRPRNPGTDDPLKPVPPELYREPFFEEQLKINPGPWSDVLQPRLHEQTEDNPYPDDALIDGGDPEGGHKYIDELMRRFRQSPTPPRGVPRPMR